jgi:ppGpp synthetase/RelA/SpoT-type nucleotidyltranferase
MTDQETALLERWHSEAPMYSAWGALVAETLVEVITQAVSPIPIGLFLRIPINPRLKDSGSLLAKAFWRGKNYKNPYEDIEDKVGLRVIVLLQEEIRIVERLICDNKLWTAHKARDFEEEIKINPFEFDYQSVHYIVRSNKGNIYNEREIIENTPCEIQIRTILQHAYSELTHDTIYKPSLQADQSVKRAAAKSMALIEATEDYFTQVKDRLEKAQASGRKLTSYLNKKYKEFTNLDPQVTPLNTIIIDQYKLLAKELFEDEISEFLRRKEFLANNIRERAPSDLLYRQPAVLLVYWAIDVAPNAAAERDPLLEADLAPLYGDLGARLPSARLS